MKKEKVVKVYSNGYIVRAYNRRIDVEEMDNGDFYVSMVRYDSEGANKPAIKHDCLRGMVRVSEIKMSSEGMGDFVYGYLEYIKSKVGVKLPNVDRCPDCGGDDGSFCVCPPVDRIIDGK